METHLASWCVGQGKDYESVRGLDYRATEKADRSARFECTRCFNGLLSKRKKPAANISKKYSVLRLSGLSSLIQLYVYMIRHILYIAWWEKRITFRLCRNIRIHITCIILHNVDPKGCCNLRLLKGDICVTNFIFRFYHVWLKCCK